MEKIEKKFKAFCKVRESGITNMYDTQNVIKVAWGMYNTSLSHEDCKYIMQNFTKLNEKYNEGIK